MSQALICLIYASRRLAAASDLDRDVSDILVSSIANNRLSAISGLLITDQDWFLQALEGPEDAVERTYERIRRDRRHFDATLKMTRQGQTRLFPRWTMCAQTISTADETIVRTLVQSDSFDPFACDAHKALCMLSTVADLHGKLLNDRYAELQGRIRLAG